MASKNIDENAANQSTGEEEQGFVISISTLFRKVKKYFLPWLLCAIILAGLVGGLTVLRSSDDSNAPVQAVVNFSYDGIEKGKNPDGTDFDPSSLKSPAVIEAALKESGISGDMGAIRSHLTISPIIPEDAYNRITAYKKIYENKQTIDAAQAMLDESWFSTKYNIKLNYKGAGLKRDDAVLFLNTMTECYRDYFLEKFGSSNALGNALTAIDYTTYDYAEAVDRIDNALTNWKNYINDLAKQDTKRFRSTVTGYTFSDLSATIDSLQQLDVDLLTSYITANNATKDKERLLAYYEYRIDELTRSKAVSTELLSSIQNSIDTYEKDNILVFGQTSKDGSEIQSTVASQKYDDLITQKNNTQNTLSKTVQDINYYNQRIASMRRPIEASDAVKEEVEKELKRLNETVNNLVKIVNDTIEDYFENVALSDSYNILAPASNSKQSMVMGAVKAAIRPILGLEALLFVLFLLLVFVQGVKEDNRKKPQKVESSVGNQTAESAGEPEKTEKTEKESKQEKKQDNEKK